MRKHHRERLLRLADLLDTVPVKHFDLGVWARSEKPCETAGCAVGWAASDPWFQQRGLRLSEQQVVFAPRQVEHRSYEAAVRFFGVRFDDAWELFSPLAYTSGNRTRPKTVANRIRKFVEAES